VTVYSQDDPLFPEAVESKYHDHNLAMSWHWDVETVPTLMYVQDGKEMARTVGWSRTDWEAMTGVEELGAELPEMRPGCGSLSVDPNLAEGLAIKFGETTMRSRRVEFASLEDEFDAMFDRGWSDGLPIVPPTEERVARMLAGTQRRSDEVLAVVPPGLVECTVEKVAINAVMAGCLPTCVPLVLPSAAQWAIHQTIRDQTSRRTRLLGWQIPHVDFALLFHQT
jgi:hypothetical protein